MTKKRSTKHALILSAFSLLLCISMLIGSTYAWFTDEVTSTGNKIETGTLLIDLLIKDPNGEYKSIKDSHEPIFGDDILWEPGYHKVVNASVVNIGSLALRYNLQIVSDAILTEDVKLSDVIEVYYAPTEVVMPTREAFNDAVKNGEINLIGTLTEVIAGGTMIDDHLIPGEDAEHFATIVLKIQETAGNEYQGLTVGTTFDIKLFATQYTYEKDSFDDQYDANISMEKQHEITDLETLQKAFEEGGTGLIVNMYIPDVDVNLGEDKSLSLNMNTSTLEKKADGDYAIVNHGDLSITGEGTILSNMYGSIENWGKLYINNLNIEVEGPKYGFHVKGGEVEINNLTLKAQRGGLNIQAGDVTINSGSVTTTAYSTNIGYLVYADGTGNVVINGGDFKYTGAYYKHGVLYAGGNASIVVNGGTFGKGGSNSSKKPWLQTAQNGTITLCGGTFAFDPTTYVDKYETITIADGYKVVKTAENEWKVQKIA